MSEFVGGKEKKILLWKKNNLVQMYYDTTPAEEPHTIKTSHIIPFNVCVIWVVW